MSLTNRHRNDRRCNACDKFLIAGGVALSDGRSYCKDCQVSAVIVGSDVERQRRIVTPFLNTLGINVKTDIAIDLCGKNHPDFTGDKLGLTRTVTESRNGKVVARTVRSIGVLSHLPSLQFDMVLVHEHYHVWEHRHGLSSGMKISEGMAELLAWIYVAQNGGDRDLAVLLKQGIEQRKDAIYGAGFRVARRAMARYGLSELLKRVRQGKSIATFLDIFRD